MEYSLENCMFLSNLNNSGTSKWRFITVLPWLGC
jgi:hypothetical protein